MESGYEYGRWQGVERKKTVRVDVFEEENPEVYSKEELCIQEIFRVE